MNLFITCPFNVENSLTQELQELGIPARREGRGVSAPATMENVYIINYASRLAIRVLWPLAHFNCYNRDDFYEETKKIVWSEYLSVDQTFAIDANVVDSPNFTNSHFAALVVKDAICDFFREKCGNRPSVNIKTPDIQLSLFIHKNKATISLDTSGPPLFKRGYRTHTIDAPLQETIAAAILRLSNYTPEDIVCDPYCGSGTLLWEAAFMATETPPGFFRKEYGFFKHPLFCKKGWEQIQTKLNSRISPLPALSIFGGDRDLKAIESCRAIKKKTKFPLHFQHSLISNFYSPKTPTLIVTNPPYGHRLKNITDPYEPLYQLLTKHPGEIRAAILSPLETLPPPFAQSKQRAIALVNGGIDIFLHLYPKQSF
jgi:putative N6-adenine-specific DNA methylase